MKSYYLGFSILGSGVLLLFGIIIYDIVIRKKYKTKYDTLKCPMVFILSVYVFWGLYATVTKSKDIPLASLISIITIMNLLSGTCIFIRYFYLIQNQAKKISVQHENPGLFEINKSTYDHIFVQSNGPIYNI
jgi:hypothetical protein